MLSFFGITRYYLVTYLTCIYVPTIRVFKIDVQCSSTNHLKCTFVSVPNTVNDFKFVYFANP